jgi:hypothetical protein
MSDFKSKIPDLNELTSMAGKLFAGVKTSVKEIINDYKKKRSEPMKEAATPKKETPKETPKDTSESK